MAEFRKDVRGEPIILSPGRAARPYDFRSGAEERQARCPFCPGREDRTPPEVLAIRPEGGAADGPGWSLRVVPNRYPAAPPEPVELAPHEGLPAESAWSRHEVVIETPDHGGNLADLDIAALLGVYQQRLLAARGDERLEHATIFKNHGPEAGASLEHPHSQLLALPFIPPRPLGELAAARNGELERRYLIEAASPERRIGAGEKIVAVAPFDSRFPYEVRLFPRRPEPCFEQTDAATIAELAKTVRALLQAIDRLFTAPAYHLLLATALFRAAGRESFWWRLELIPRISKVAGFEWATGLYINQTAPETAAGRYREALGE